MAYINGLKNANAAALAPFEARMSIVGAVTPGAIDTAYPNNWQMTADNAANTAPVNFLIPVDPSNITQINNPTGVNIAGPFTLNGVPSTALIHFDFPFIQAAGAITQAVLPVRFNMQLMGISLAYSTASSSGTVTVEHLTGTTAPGSGTALLTAPMSLSATANTYYAGTLISTIATLQAVAGDRFGFVFAGTMTGLVGLSIILAFQRF